MITTTALITWTWFVLRLILLCIVGVSENEELASRTLDGKTLIIAKGVLAPPSCTLNTGKPGVSGLCFLCEAITIALVPLAQGKDIGSSYAQDFKLSTCGSDSARKK